jgi:8-oxo-dGTP pyrophosphatase MutT (NUDIX family)
MTDNISWREKSRRELGNYGVFTVAESLCDGPGGTEKTFSLLKAGDWGIVAPLIEEADGSKSFVLVRQWRPGEGTLSLEFPGGVIEKGESPERGAARELLEETGTTADSLKEIAVFNPNPAVNTNHVHFFLARGVHGNAPLHLDKDEFLNVEKVPLKDIVDGMGRPPYIHCIMGAMLFAVLRELNFKV